AAVVGAGAAVEQLLLISRAENSNSKRRLSKVNKQMRELLAKLREAEERVRAAIAEENDDLATKAMEDVRKIRARIEALKELEGAEPEGGVRLGDDGDEPPSKDEQKLAQEYKRVFLKAIRRQRISPAEASII